MVQGLSSAGRPLLVRYDLEALARTVDRDELMARSGGLWRYREFLPVRHEANELDLGELVTPLIRLPEPHSNRSSAPSSRR